MPGAGGKDGARRIRATFGHRRDKSGHWWARHSAPWAHEPQASGTWPHFGGKPDRNECSGAMIQQRTAGVSVLRHPPPCGPPAPTPIEARCASAPLAPDLAGALAHETAPFSDVVRSLCGRALRGATRIRSAVHTLRCSINLPQQVPCKFLERFFFFFLGPACPTHEFAQLLTCPGAGACFGDVFPSARARARCSGVRRSEASRRRGGIHRSAVGGYSRGVLGQAQRV